jgi:hypothetical protein
VAEVVCIRLEVVLRRNSGRLVLSYREMSKKRSEKRKVVLTPVLLGIVGHPSDFLLRQTTFVVINPDTI